MGIWEMWVYSTVRHWVPCAFRHLAAHVMFYQRRTPLYRLGRNDRNNR